MSFQSLTHLKTPRQLLDSLHRLVARDQENTAAIVAHIAEAERRKLHVPAGYASMYRYCVHELHMSEGVAYNRIRAGRAARRFPVVLEALADGRLHVHGVKLLSPFLRARNVDELLAAAAHKSSRQIEALLAERFPRPDLPTRIRPLLGALMLDGSAPLSGEGPLAPDATGPLVARPVVPCACEEAGDARVPVAPLPGQSHARLAPVAPGRFALQVTLSQEAHDLLRRAQELLAHAQPESEIANVLERALGEFVQRLEHQKFGDTDAPRARRASCDTRAIPAEVRRQVAERDGKRCTFVSDQGVRCPERSGLEFDHVLPFSKGGRSTVSNLRLRCRAHNQYEAERVYGPGFMQGKCEAARRARAVAAGRIPERPAVLATSASGR